MSFISRLLSPRFRKRCRLRTLIRGYAQLKREKRIGLGRRVKSALADKPLPSIAEQASSLIFGAAIGNAERAVRQYLFERHVGTAMNRAILLALGSKSAVVFALPPVWRQILVEHGLKVDDTRSALAWRRSLMLHFGRNILSMGQTLLSVLTAQGQAVPQERYAYLDGLSAGNLPQGNGLGRSYDICSWYAQWNGRHREIMAIRHSVAQAAPAAGGLRVEPVVEPFQLLRGTANILLLWAWCFVATVLAGFDLFRGRWWHALLLAEATRAKAVALCPTEVLAVDYLFHYSGNMYRPLWTYEAERKRARIVCYFYSTFEQAKLDTGYEPQRFEWGCASWPLYLVWDSYQEEQLRRDMGDEPEIRVVGPIWFSAGSAELELMPNSVAVFDVEAHRQALHFPFTTAGDYIAAHPDISARFLNDVQQALAEYGLPMAFKKKREIGNRGSKEYKRLLQEIADAANVTIVAANVSALQLIEKCAGVISMPFTSTALYLRERNIPSVYYDPTGWIQRDDRAAHGIPILTGIDELRQWISNTLVGCRT
ncbi:MAG: polysaccharide biosynthesis PFTS motif protein [Proteobacteria bacterium]|nr:polysaccharide biosynthesis PFTS motif protein [Pseudomonadota bacterium]